MSDIRNIGQLSLTTAMTLFKLKITPIATYGLELIWDHLKKKDLRELERVKAVFLKRVMSISKHTLSRLAYELAREPFYIEDLRYEKMLPSTAGYDELLHELKEKKQAIWSDFYTTDAMTSTDWTKSGYELRHSVTRFAVHGFHYKACSTKRYHEPNLDCVCDWCGKPCDRYHVLQCSNRIISLTALTTES